jgi:tetratricopeptide (TPR) repeat protein
VTPLGSTILSRDLVAAGESTRVAAIDGRQVNVLVFFRPDKEFSLLGLRELSPCVALAAGKPIRWVTVTSARQPVDASLSAVREAGLAVPVLVDEGDAYSAELGISQLPAVAVFEKGARLAAFQTFTKLNFCERVLTHVRRALGEISEEEARAELDPAPIPIKGGTSVAKRHVRKAWLLLRGGDAARALGAAREAVAADGNLAAAHSTLGACLAEAGNCTDALAAFEKALDLDPGDVRALEGKAACLAGVDGLRPASPP